MTATRRAESVFDLPYDVSATTEQRLDAAGVVDFSKLQQIVPGLVYNGDGSAKESTRTASSCEASIPTGRACDTPSLTVAPLLSRSMPVFANLRLPISLASRCCAATRNALWRSIGRGNDRLHLHEPDLSAFSGRIQVDTKPYESCGWRELHARRRHQYSTRRYARCASQAATRSRTASSTRRTCSFSMHRELPFFAPQCHHGQPSGHYSQKDVDHSEQNYLHAASNTQPVRSGSCSRSLSGRISRGRDHRYRRHRAGADGFSSTVTPGS